MKSKTPQSGREIFPFALIQHNVEGLSARHFRRTGLLYRVVLLTLISGALSLPWVSVDVSKRSRGMLRPLTESNQVMTATAGLVVENRLETNAAVCAGDTLLVLSTAELTAQRAATRQRLEENQRLLQDLELLLQGMTATGTSEGHPVYPNLQSALYQKDYASFRQQADEAALRFAHADRRLQRQMKLLQAGSVSKMEEEQSRFEYELGLSALQNLHHQKRQLWAQERNRYQRENQEIRAELAQLQLQERQYFVTAPLTGTINQHLGLQPGNFVGPRQQIATLSPDGGLHAEVYVSPADIGLIRPNMPVQLQIDAFHHNRWGMATGRVVEIAPDVIQTADQSVFLVRCQLDQEALQLPNGYTGRFKPGMSLTAHFTLARRTLLDLLHDKVDDWLNPHSALPEPLSTQTSIQ